jgi:lipopolysaccharide biosynthesis regulator YciM
VLARLYRRAGENEKADRALEVFQALKKPNAP